MLKAEKGAVQLIRLYDGPPIVLPDDIKTVKKFLHV